MQIAGYLLTVECTPAEAAVLAALMLGVVWLVLAANRYAKIHRTNLLIDRIKGVK